MAEKKFLVGRDRQFAETVLDEFLGDLFGARAHHLHLVERLHRGADACLASGAAVSLLAMLIA